MATCYYEIITSERFRQTIGDFRLVEGNEFEGHYGASNLLLSKDLRHKMARHYIPSNKEVRQVHRYCDDDLLDLLTENYERLVKE
tara:strand:- start:218 stop:472 length:255 start_codon:yes stop_codon:yes gene_type:complete